MPTLNAQGQAVYQSGEALPAVGSSAYSNPIQPAAVPATTNITSLVNHSGQFQVPPQTVNASSYGSFVNSLNAGIGGLQQQEAQQQNALDTQIQSLMQGTAELGNKGNDYLAALNTPQFQAQQQQLADARLKFAQAQTKFNNDYFANEGKGYDTSLVQGLQALNRTRASVELGNQATVIQTLQGNIDAAKQTAKETVDAKYMAQEADLKAKQLFYDYNKDKLQGTQKKLADERANAIQASLAKLQAEKQQAQFNASQAVDLFKSGALDQNGLALVLSGKTSLLGALTTLPKQTTDKFDATIQTVGRLASPTTQGKVIGDLTKYIASGDYKAAYQQIGNSVSDSLTGSNKQKFDDARTDIQVMQGLANAIKSFQDAGGDTGLLKGSANDIETKLGKVTNPKLTELATQLNREFQAYRLSMTGAAFSPAESREYAKVNPTTGKSLDLNYSIIQGALNQLNNRVQGTIVSKAGQGAQYIKEYADGASQPTTYNGVTIPGVESNASGIFQGVTLPH